MAQKYEVLTEAEHHIHNDLEACAKGLADVMREKIASDQRSGVGFDMMGSLIFIAFAVEAKVNFVGWKKLKNGWPERASLREKIDLLVEILPLDLTWGRRPLQTINDLRKFRDTLAHGKPREINEREVRDVEPEIWEALRAEWEGSVKPEFVERCIEDMDALWSVLVERAGIPDWETITRANQSLTVIQDGN